MGYAASGDRQEVNEDNLILALRRLLEQPRINTFAAITLTMQITRKDVALWDQLGVYEDGVWVNA